MLGIGVSVLCIDKPAEAQIYPWCAIYDGGMGFAASQHLNDAWKPRADSAVCANRIRNTSLHLDRIR
jgi:hypothetical protein